jgi:phosphatidate cytidylyltransferase
MCTCVGVGKRFVFLVPIVAFAAAGPLATWFFDSALKFIAFLAMLAFAVFFLCMAIEVFRGGKDSFATLAEAMLGVVYITVGFACVALLRRLTNGAYLYGLVFVGAWVTDTMAYFTGYFLGKHKLCPTISPKKTIEGSIGGVVFCAGAFALYGWIMQIAFGLTPNYGMLLVSGAVLSVVSQIGDLLASLIKREHGIKDYGKLMPGHGGVMDRFDSILAVAPFLFVLCAFGSAFALFT